MKLFRNILFIAIFIVLLSCEKKAEFNGVIPTEKLVANSVINADSTTQLLSVSSSKFALKKDDKYPTLPYADIRLFISDKEAPVEKSVNKQDNSALFYTVKTGKLLPGNNIRISVNAKGYPIALANDIVPSKPAILSAIGEWKLNSGEGHDLVAVSLKMKDPEEEQNFYRIIIRTRLLFPQQKEVEYKVKDMIIGDDPVFSRQQDVLGTGRKYPYTIFSDELINGKEYTLKFYYEDDNYEKQKGNPFYIPGVKYETQIELQSLSRNLYLYMHTLLLNKNNNSYSEPVKVHTNVVNGYGIVGIYMPTSSKIIIE